MSGHHRHASKMPFKCRFVGGRCWRALSGIWILSCLTTHSRAIKEETIAINYDWIFKQACRLSHDIHIVSHSFITFDNLLKFITKIRLSNNRCNVGPRTSGKTFWIRAWYIHVLPLSTKHQLSSHADVSRGA